MINPYLQYKKHGFADFMLSEVLFRLSMEYNRYYCLAYLLEACLEILAMIAYSIISGASKGYLRHA